MSHINIQLWPSLLVLLLFLLSLLLLLLGLSCILSIKCLYTWIFICLSIFQVLHKHQQYKIIFLCFKGVYWKICFRTKVIGDLFTIWLNQSNEIYTIDFRLSKNNNNNETTLMGWDTIEINHVSWFISLFPIIVKIWYKYF